MFKRKRNLQEKEQNKMKCKVYWQYVAVFLMLLVICQPTPAAERRRPNIIILLADDLGYGELGCQGNTQIPTPYIDSLARNGTRFTNGYVTGSVCSPSRAGLMTGKYQNRFGYESNVIGANNENPQAGLPPTEVTLANHLHDAGYVTALIGKWHLGGTAFYHPMRRGFDEFFGFLHEGHFYVPSPYEDVTTMLRRRTLPVPGLERWTHPGGKLIYSNHMGRDEPAYDADNPILRGGQPVQEKDYLTDAWTREALDFIDRYKSQPFFLYLAYNAVHSPLQGADRYMRRFEHIEDIHRRIFAAMLSNLDASVGAILRKLQFEGLEEDTLIFFLSDNGGPTRELTSSNLPLRGGKGDMYEGGIRVPFIAQWKGTIPAQKIYYKPVISLDIFATSAAVASSPIAKKDAIDGVNLIPYLKGTNDRAPHKELFWRMGNKSAFRSGDYKIVRNVKGKQNADWQLFNLSKDLSETTDLAKDNPNKLAELIKLWEKYNSEMAPPAWSK
jgi:arylsulfatase B